MLSILLKVTYLVNSDIMHINTSTTYVTKFVKKNFICIIINIKSIAIQDNLLCLLYPAILIVFLLV